MDDYRYFPTTDRSIVMNDNRWSWAQADSWDKAQKDAGLISLKAELLDKSRYTKSGNISKRYINLCMKVSLLQDEILDELADGK